MSVIVATVLDFIQVCVKRKVKLLFVLVVKVLVEPNSITMNLHVVNLLEE